MTHKKLTPNAAVAFVVRFAITCLLASPLQAQTWIDMEEAENYVPRHEASFVQAGDKFYLFGGRESARRLDAYDYATNTWSWSRDALAPIEFNHFQAREYQGLIWVIGAFRTNRFPSETPAESIYVFDPARSAWMEGPSIPEDRRRGSTGLVVHEDNFYVVGGNTIGHDGGYVNWFDKYDPQTGIWTSLGDAPNARDHFHAEVVNDKLYAVGGRLSGGRGGVFAPLIPNVDVYDFTTNSWSTLPEQSNLPTPRAAAAVAAFDDKIFVMGGEGNGRAYDTVEALDPATNTWQTIDSLNHARHGTQAIVSGEGIYVVAGSPNQGGGNQRNMEVFNVDMPSGEKSVAGELSAPESATVTVGTPESIRLDHNGGNQGVFVTDITLSGDAADQFSVSFENPFLLPVGSATELLVQYDGIEGDARALLDIRYSGDESIQVPLTGTLVPEPVSGPMFPVVCCLVLLLRRKTRAS